MKCYLDKKSISPETFNMNSSCFIRKEHRCGKIFGASKSCFIACPSDDEVETILELISEKLTKVGIEPIIAVKERAYGQDIFCTKICGKIIESKFCFVILNDTKKDEVNIPSPNVYYEYGLMTSLRKYIIPLQKENLKLAFNIQSYDTVKYSNKNIGTELDRAIKEAIRITEQMKKTEKELNISDKIVLHKFELAGLILKDTNWFLNHEIEDTNFKGFGDHEKKFYLYLGKIDEKKDFDSYYEDFDVVLYRTEKKHQELIVDLAKCLERKAQISHDFTDEQIRKRYLVDTESQILDVQSKMDLMEVFYICFVINPKLESNKFLERINLIVNKYKRFRLISNSGDELILDDIKINKYI